MIITITAILMGIAMTLGGLFPSVADGFVYKTLDQQLNHPEHIRVVMHPKAPSFSMANGQLDYAHFEAGDFTLRGVPIQFMTLDIKDLDFDIEARQLRKPVQGVVKLRLSEEDINEYLKSDTFQALLEQVQRKQKVVRSLDAEISSASVDIQDDRLVIEGLARTMGGFFTIPFELSGQFRLGSEKELYLYDVTAKTLNRHLSQEMLESLLSQINPVLNLNDLAAPEDAELYFRSIELKDDQIELVGELTLKQLP